MREKFINFIIKRSGIKKDCSKTDLLKTEYSLKCLYTIMTKFSIILALSFVFNTFKEFLLLIGIFTPLRMFGFGFHAKNNFQCWIISLIMYCAFPLLIKYINVPYIIITFSAILSVIVIIIYSPAETIKRPLVNKDKNKKRKIIITVICFIYLGVIALTNKDYLKETVSISLLFQASLVNPITYKLLD